MREVVGGWRWRANDAVGTLVRGAETKSIYVLVGHAQAVHENIYKAEVLREGSKELIWCMTDRILSLSVNTIVNNAGETICNRQGGEQC